MPIEIGQELPDATFKELGPEGLRVVTLSDLTKGKKVVIFGLPGAFTPTCHAKQMPSYLENYDALKAKGVDAIACIAVNDPFVLSAWGKSLDVGDRVTILSDFDASFTKSIDLTFDGAMAGLGTRSRRYAMIVEDGRVVHLAVEEAPPVMEVTAAENILEVL